MSHHFSLIIGLLVVHILTSTGAYPLFPLASQAQFAVGSPEIRKEIAKVTPEGDVLTRLTIVNNGSVSLFGIRIFEYFNPVVRPQESVTVTSQGKTRKIGITTSSATGVSSPQFILELPPTETLLPKDKLILEYWSRSESPGDYYIPPSLVWISYQYGISENTINIYSNGLLLHVPNQVEALLREALPYVISITVVSAWIAVFIKNRRYL